MRALTGLARVVHRENIRRRKLWRRARRRVSARLELPPSPKATSKVRSFTLTIISKSTTSEPIVRFRLCTVVTHAAIYLPWPPYAFIDRD